MLEQGLTGWTSDQRLMADVERRQGVLDRNGDGSSGEGQGGDISGRASDGPDAKITDPPLPLFHFLQKSLAFSYPISFVCIVVENQFFASSLLSKLKEHTYSF
ncbi:unnamed protein product [Cuscuta epithymum]|uniref:Uncharacterized protein n=1 Tax=Cuscuta epithymum TaxID=186058 RepID=A0AAV0C622_9ASTE|nr:unnamed protein product [Cuscuta epithymum]